MRERDGLQGAEGRRSLRKEELKMRVRDLGFGPRQESLLGSQVHGLGLVGEVKWRPSGYFRVLKGKWV